MCFGGNAAMGSGSVSSSQSSSSSTSSKPKRSAGRGSGKNKTTKQFVGSTVSNFTTDLKMGLSTFGMNKADQAAKLSEMGYSPKAIDSYQARTAASQERMRKQMASSNDNDNDNLPSPVRNAITSMVGTAPTAPTPTPTPTPPPAPAPISEDTSAPEEGSAEAEVLAEAGVEADGTPTGRGRRGRASTIETTPQGLITKAKTTKKKSLMSKMIT